ncbi:putative T7SS-secreted protein [Dactylosporangium sp. CS-033363]|uniref:putative T7SS-secreted protein n=1 Tax=Dactylosporangium sp. CS-033363 TaxID=3239935 RepID=UPI003D92A8E4
MTSAALRTTTVLRGGDPAPGDGWAVQAVVRQLRDTVTAVQSASAVLAGIGTDRDVWTGPAADAFAPRKEDLSRRLATAGRAYGRAADALERWSRRLSELQTEAAEVAAQARRAHDEHQAEQARLAACSPGPPPVVPPGPPPAVAALQRRHDAIAADAARDRKACADEIDAAAAELGGSGGGFAELIKGVLVHGPAILHAIRDVLGFAALICSVVPFLMPLAPIVDSLYLGFALLALVVDVVALETGHGSGNDVKDSAIALGLGVFGKLGTVAAHGARTAGKLEAAGEAAANSAKLGGKVAPILSNLGMAEKAAETSIKAGVAADRATAYGEKAAELAKDTTKTGVLTGAAREVLHPIAAGREAKAVQDLVKESTAYGRLPLLERWVPDGHRVPALVGLVPEAADKLKTVTEIPKTFGEEVPEAYREIQDWIGNEVQGDDVVENSGGLRR